MTNCYKLVLAVLFLLLVSATGVKAQNCGDYICDYGEEWCITDCGGSSYCGDSICSPELGEDRYTCTTDCVCGDGICSTGEAARAAGAQVMPTEPKLQVEPEPPVPKPVHPVNPAPQ